MFPFWASAVLPIMFAEQANVIALYGRILINGPCNTSNFKQMKLNEELQYRLGVASRAVAAILGGYAVTALATALLAVILPMVRIDAVLTATLLSFTVYTCAVLWVFAARNAFRAWIGIVLPAAILGLGLLAHRSFA
ncbi:Uncharacterized conserved protein [Janthinobacterium sp. Marseille]|nr:Uncharacterized conserved protein [Janthinobacterium sp. Marseille]